MEKRCPSDQSVLITYLPDISCDSIFYPSLYRLYLLLEYHIFYCIISFAVPCFLLRISSIVLHLLLYHIIGGFKILVDGPGKVQWRFEGSQRRNLNLGRVKGIGHPKN